MVAERANTFHQLPDAPIDGPITTLPTPQPAPAPAPAPTVASHAVNVLQAGQQLTRGDRLRSLNGRVYLVLQDDGNLVLYRSDDQAALWSSHTSGKPVTRAVMQADGNFVCYGDDGHAYWATGTDGRGGTTIVLQDDANLVIYAPGSRAVWASNTMHSWQPFVATTDDVHLDTGEWMNSAASLAGNGLISGHTRIWTTNEMSGFHGSVLPVVLDANQKIIWPAQIDPQKHWYGVDGSWIPGSSSDRTVYWTNQVDAATMAQAKSLALIQFKDPKNMLMRDLKIVADFVAQAGSLLKSIAAI